MNRQKKTFSKLSASDFKMFPVWESIRGEFSDGPVVPAEGGPFKTLKGKVVGWPVTLANGTEVLGIFSEIDTSDAKWSHVLMQVALIHRGERFIFSRRRVLGWDKFGPAGVARFLRRSVDEIYPMKYDFSCLVAGVEAKRACKGTFDKDPSDEFTIEEVARKAVEKSLARYKSAMGVSSQPES